MGRWFALHCAQILPIADHIRSQQLSDTVNKKWTLPIWGDYQLAPHSPQHEFDPGFWEFWLQVSAATHRTCWQWTDVISNLQGITWPLVLNSVLNLYYKELGILIYMYIYTLYLLTYYTIYMYDYHYHCFDSTIILHIGLKLISQFESWISSWEGCWNGQISGLGKPILGLGQSPGCLALTASSFQIFGSYRCMWNPSNKNIYDDHEWMDDPNSGLVTWSFIDVSFNSPYWDCGTLTSTASHHIEMEKSQCLYITALERIDIIDVCGKDGVSPTNVPPPPTPPMLGIHGQASLWHHLKWWMGLALLPWKAWKTCIQ